MTASPDRPVAGRIDQAILARAVRELAPQGTETLDGRVYSVLTDTVNGMHTVTSVTPTPDGETERAEIRSIIRSLLDLAAHESGPTKAKVILTSVGPRVLSCSIPE